MSNRKILLSVILIILFSVLFITLILQNMASTRIQFLLFGASVPVIVIILCSGLMGFVLGVLVTVVTAWQAREKKKGPAVPKDEHK